MSKYAKFSVRSIACELLKMPIGHRKDSTTVITVEWTKGSSSQIALTIDKYGSSIPAWVCGADGDDVYLEDYLERVHHLKSISYMDTLDSNHQLITRANWEIVFERNKGVYVLIPGKSKKARLIRNKE